MKAGGKFGTARFDTPGTEYTVKRLADLQDQIRRNKSAQVDPVKVRMVYQATRPAWDDALLWISSITGGAEIAYFDSDTATESWDILVGRPQSVGIIFPGTEGAPIEPGTYSEVVQIICRSGVGFHMAAPSSETQLVRPGGDVIIGQRLVVEIVADGDHGVTWDDAYVATPRASMPTTTVANKIVWAEFRASFLDGAHPNNALTTVRWVCVDSETTGY